MAFVDPLRHLTPMENVQLLDGVVGVALFSGSVQSQ